MSNIKIIITLTADEMAMLEMIVKTYECYQDQEDESAGNRELFLKNNILIALDNCKVMTTRQSKRRI